MPDANRLLIRLKQPAAHKRAMVEIAFLSFLFVAVLLGAVLGFIGHYSRAHLRFPPEDLGLGEPLDTLTRDDYQFEKHVVGAKWDDAGYWDALSNRNLIYYVVSGAGAPLLFGFVFWEARAAIVGKVCAGLDVLGLASPFC